MVKENHQMIRSTALSKFEAQFYVLQEKVKLKNRV